MLVYCGQTVGSIKMKLGVEVGLGPVDIAVDGDPKRGAQQPPLFGPCIVAIQLDGSRYHLVWR